MQCTDPADGLAMGPQCGTLPGMQGGMLTGRASSARRTAVPGRP
jgi:hypothetical protein